MITWFQRKCFLASVLEKHSVLPKCGDRRHPTRSCVEARGTLDIPEKPEVFITAGIFLTQRERMRFYTSTQDACIIGGVGGWGCWGGEAECVKQTKEV